MKQVLGKAGLATLISAAASCVIVVAAVRMLGGAVEETAALMIALVCALLVAFPVSARVFWREKELADALATLLARHEELAREHARLTQKARLDEMTGLLNRQAFMEALTNARRRTDAGALLIIDADNFKYINDIHGHQQGDTALGLIAGAIGGGVREADLVARIGGEEFAAFLAGADEEEAMIVAERIRLGVEALRFWPRDGALLPLSVSIGVARLRPDASWPQMMREADLRLYEAKHGGRNRVVFEDKGRAAA